MDSGAGELRFIPILSHAMRAQTKEEFIAKWSTRVGRHSAELAVTSARRVGIGGLLVPVWSIVFVLGHGSPALIAVASVLVVLDVFLLTTGIARMRTMYGEMSDRFGTRVWLLNSPSLRDGQFEAWCKRHGVDPTTGRPVAQD